ncbi:hypothetical protein G7Y41_00105 [Schaalia sp. ZJ405]|uniref:lipid II flippase MurJ n=1 Tax=Schaalia sp. ZJ405 TaxID=2709403 RepID=UPI0013EC3DED|nr:lipid II flippase MurJ [Schaalia sp. ZJ405]QPK81336.1 hypothetical protein G7Y41_00105 [Schaalia sp. ZJ405]
MSDQEPEKALTASGTQRRSVLRASALMASGTMASRILGFVRSALLLAAIGSAGGGVSAAFQTANALPNTVFNLLASGVLDAVLVPQIVNAIKRRHDGQVYVNRLLTLAGTILFLVTIVSLIAAPLLVIVTAAAYDTEIRTLAILFALLCLPQLFFYGLYNLLGELLNARGIFGPYMWAPVVNNIIGIAGLVAFLGLWGKTDSRIEVADFTSAQFWVLAGSATLGVIAQALILLVPIKRAGIRLSLDFHFRHTSFGAVPKVAGWTFATLAVSQIGVLSTNNIAAFADAYAKTVKPVFDAHGVLISGTVIAGINAYATAFMMFMVPQSLVTVSLTTAIFTRLAEAVSEKDDRSVASHYHLGVQTITSLTLLAAAIFMAASVPMMQMVLYSTRHQDVVISYAWILVALMPGVASTGLVLMSQRVFFAYEDVRPVFLMGIVPTILQVIVGWGMYFLTGAHWWVVGAALGETVCRLVHGIIAVVWVSRRNPLVNARELLTSYGKLAVSAAVAGTVAFGVLVLVGVETPIKSTVIRFLVAFAKMVLVAVITSIVYMLAVRVLSPKDSAATIAPLLARLRVPAPIRHFLAVSSPQLHADTAIMASEYSTQTEEHMDRDDELIPTDAPSTDESTPSGFTAALESHDHSSVPDFDAVVSGPDEGVEEDAPVEVPEPQAGPSLQDRAQAFLTSTGSVISGWMLSARNAVKKSTNSEAEDAGARAAEAVGGVPVDQPLAADAAATVSDSPSTPREGADDDPSESDRRILDDAQAIPAAHTSIPQVNAEDRESAEPHDEPPHDQPRSSTRRFRDAVLGAASKATAGVASTAARAASGGSGSGSAGRGGATGGPGGGGSGNEPRDSQGRRLIDPTAPTLIFALILVIVGAIWSFSVALSPAKLNIDARLNEMQSAQQSGAQSGEAAPEPKPEVKAPQISSVSILSWRNDGGDHPDLAVNMIDGDPATSWRSRWYDYNVFLDDSNITILVNFAGKTKVSEVSLDMDPTTQGGEVVVRNVTDTNNPRGGTELTSSALSPTTTIPLPEPVETNAIALSFRTLPVSVDGNIWAWINELHVK